MMRIVGRLNTYIDENCVCVWRERERERERERDIDRQRDRQTDSIFFIPLMCR